MQGRARVHALALLIHEQHAECYCCRDVIGRCGTYSTVDGVAYGYAQYAEMSYFR